MTKLETFQFLITKGKWCKRYDFPAGFCRAAHDRLIKTKVKAKPKDKNEAWKVKRAAHVALWSDLWEFLERQEPRSLPEKVVIGELMAAISLSSREANPSDRLFFLGLYDDPNSRYVEAWGDFVVHDEKNNRAYLPQSYREDWKLKDSHRECVDWLKGRHRMWVPAAWSGP